VAAATVETATRSTFDRCRAEVVSDPAAFAALESEWNDAVARARVPHPFMTHEWLQAWWHSFGDARQLHIIVVRAGAKIIAIAPLMCESAWMFGVRARELGSLFNNYATDS